MRARVTFAFLLLTALLLAGCDSLGDEHDAPIGQTRADYEALGDAPGGAPPEPPPAQPPPAFLPVVAPAAEPALYPNPRVSVSATEDVPLKDVLYQLARQAEVEVEIDPRIAGGVIFTAHNRPFLNVVERISRLAGLRYEVENNVVKVEVDDPYKVDYEIPYLNQARQTESRVSISTELSSTVAGTGGDGGGAQGGDTSSSSVVTGVSSADFFTELKEALDLVVGNAAPRGLPTATGAENGSVALLRQAGLLSVFGTQRQHDAVKSYLQKLRRAISAQVLIEAKIVEVTLRKQFSSGINWRAIFKDLQVAGRFGRGISTPPFDSFSAATSGVFSAAVDGEDFGVLLSFLEEFGTTRTLSSPRITVLNNQTAILKVAQNQVFFELDVQREVVDNNNDNNINDILTIDSQARTVPIGLVLAVQPSINLGEDRITMTIRPTITRIAEFVSDPAVSILSEQEVESLIPVVETREVDSVLELQSGEIAVLGGLMQERADNADAGLPVLSRIPWLGYLFKSRSEDSELVELVVLLRVQILQQPTVPAADRRLLDGFVRDPRPFALPEAPEDALRFERRPSRGES